MLSCHINRRVEIALLPRYAGNYDDTFRIGGRDRRGAVEEMRDGELSGSDGVRDVDVERGVAVRGRGVAGLGTGGRMPEVAPLS
jgi:hypothetical protein